MKRTEVWGWKDEGNVRCYVSEGVFFLVSDYFKMSQARQP